MTEKLYLDAINLAVEPHTIVVVYWSRASANLAMVNFCERLKDMGRSDWFRQTNNDIVMFDNGAEVHFVTDKDPPGKYITAPLAVSILIHTGVALRHSDTWGTALSVVSQVSVNQAKNMASLI